MQKPLVWASALTETTKSNYGKALGRFQQFCVLMELNPMEATGLDVST